MTHDQNFKNLILDYPRQAIALFAASEAQAIKQRDKQRDSHFASLTAAATALASTETRLHGRKSRMTHPRSALVSLDTAPGARCPETATLRHRRIDSTRAISTTTRTDGVR